MASFPASLRRNPHGSVDITRLAAAATLLAVWLSGAQGGQLRNPLGFWLPEILLDFCGSP